MRFFGGGVGHSQSLQVEHQHSGDTVMLSDPKSESELDRIEIPVRKDDGDDQMDSYTNNQDIEDSDNSSPSASDQEINSGLESDDDGYDSL